MSRRTVLLGCLFAATSLTSTGCCGLFRPWLWHCGGCWPRCYTPPPVCPVVSGPVMAAPAECACFSPSAGPIAVSAPAPAPAFTGGMPTYNAPPVFSGPPSTLIPGPQVMPEKPMPTTGGMK